MISQELHSSQATEGYFQTTLMPKYGCYTTKVNIGGAPRHYLDDAPRHHSSRSAEHLLSILPLLPQLANLNLEHGVADYGCCYPPGRVPMAVAFRLAAFRLAVKKVHTLRLVDFPPDCIVRFLPPFLNLKHLTIEGDETFPKDEGRHHETRSVLAKALAELQGLVSLRVGQLSTEGGPLRMEEAWDLEWASVDTLRHLSITAEQTTMAMIGFICNLAPNLASLQLNYEHFEDEEVWDLLNDQHRLPTFPRLVDLDLDGGFMHTIVFVSAFHFSPLRHLTISLSGTLSTSWGSPTCLSTYHRCLFHVDINMLDDLLLSQRTESQTLLTLDIGENTHCEALLPPTLSKHVLDLRRQFNTHTFPTNRFDGPSARNPFGGESLDEAYKGWREGEATEELVGLEKEVEMEIGLENLRGVLDLLKKCEEGKGQAEFSELVELLRPLDARRDVWLD